MHYLAHVHKEPTSDYGVSFPDFPGCVTAGETLEEAQSLAVEALALHIQGMIADVEPIPSPSTAAESPDSDVVCLFSLPLPH
jgi:predicted RNase H-like HicB family nuclease